MALQRNSIPRTHLVLGLLFLALMLLAPAGPASAAQSIRREPVPDPAAPAAPASLRAFVTSWYVHGMPWAQARAYGTEAVPELIQMLNDSAMEPHWAKVVYVLGCIGDGSAKQPLIEFMQQQKGEVSADAFRGVLGVPCAMGQIAQHDNQSLDLLMNLATRTDQGQSLGLTLSYGRYHGDALGEVLGRMALQGLGASGRPEALTVLQNLLADRTLRTDWLDNVSEAITLNQQVQSVGPQRLWGEVR